MEYLFRKRYHQAEINKCVLTTSIFHLYKGITISKPNGNYPGTKEVDDIDTLEELVIHVVGAKATETQDITIWEILPLCLPKLKQMTVVFIGPQLRLIAYSYIVYYYVTNIMVFYIKQSKDLSVVFQVIISIFRSLLCQQIPSYSKAGLKRHPICFYPRYI